MGQLLISLTRLTAARILVTFVTAGVVLTALGLYEPLVKLAGAGGKRRNRRLYRRHNSHGGRRCGGNSVRLPQCAAIHPENKNVTYTK